MRRIIKSLFAAFIFLLIAQPLFAWVNVQVTADPTAIPGDGVSTSTITATVKTPDGTPWVGHNITFSISPQIGSVNPSSTSTNSSGQAIATYTSGIAYTTITITATDTSVSPNISGYCYVSLLDTEGPTGTIKINGGAQYTKLTDVTLNLSAQDTLSGVTEMRFSNNSINWSTAEAYSTTKSWTLSPGDGTKTVYAQFSDFANNWSTAVSDDIILDTTAPEGTIKINNDAQYTKLTQVSLTLSATDQTSGLDKMQFSNDGSNWSDPEPYNTSKQPWDLLSGDGEKTVYVKFRDIAGNWTQQEIKDTVILDTTAPAVTITSHDNNSVSTVSPITVSGTIDDNAATVIVKVNDDVEIPAQVSNGTFTAEVPLDEGSNIIVAIATDPATNSSTSNSITVTYQPTTVLSIEITSPAEGARRVNTATITVSGTVSYSTATVTVNGITASVIPAEAGIQGTFTALDVPLTLGTNIVTARAVKDSEVAENAIDIILDQDPPSINIYTPDANATTRSNIVYGRVSDDTQTVTVNGTLAEILSDFRFIARPTLTEGTNTITVQAQDQATNTNQASIDITYNTQTPKVTITSPLDNSTQNISPINVQGTSASDLKYVIVDSLPARIDEGNFIVEGIILNSAYTVITAEGYDQSDNLFEDSVLVTSPQLADYQFTEILGDAYEYDEARPVAGASQTLKITLEKNGELAPNEEIQFNIIEGNGSLSQTNVFTNDNGEAQVILITDTDSSVINKVDCFVSSNPLVKMTFVVYTKPGAPSTLTKVSDDSITPVPGATVDLIVKLTDSNANPIPNENINFQITGPGTLSATQAATTYYGETKVNLTVSSNPNETTQVTATSAINPSLSITFTFTTSQPTSLTFDDVMNKVNENGNRIQDFMADIVKTSNEPGMPSEEGYKIWQKGSKTKIQLLYPEQRSYIIEKTANSINLNGTPFLTIEEQGSTAMTTTDSIESFSGDVFVLKRLSISPNFQQITKIYVDYSKGVITKVYSEYSSEVGKGKFEEERSYILIDEIWVANNIIKKSESFIDNSVYTTTENFSNIILNSGIPDSVFQ